MKRALLVGIDAYANFDRLAGCVNDVRALMPLLARHENDDPNFDCRTLTSDVDAVTRETLLREIKSLLGPGADVALLYFAGHGSSEPNDGWLVTADGSVVDKGIRMSELIGEIAKSGVQEVLAILDCCFSGAAGSLPQLGSSVTVLRGGVTILAASRPDQPAAETGDGRGRFSVHLCGGLEGGAADVLGKVTVAGLYAYLSESFGPWEQRPMFKANIDRLHELRQCRVAVPLEELRRLPELFPDPNDEHDLSPAYEPTVEPKDAEKETLFGILQRLNRVKLVVPVDEEHMYFAAMQSRSCRLTQLGKHYWHMASEGRI